MRIWLDDCRPMPKNFDVHCFSAKECIDLIEEKTSEITQVSFDHDLADTRNTPEQTGYTVACYIEELAYNRRIKRISWNVHSANPIGKKRIESAMNNAERYWKRQ